MSKYYVRFDIVKQTDNQKDELVSQAVIDGIQGDFTEDNAHELMRRLGVALVSYLTDTPESEIPIKTIPIKIKES